MVLRISFFTLLALLGLSWSACSSAPRKTPELSALIGKRVALVDVEGEPSERKIVEIALINQLVKRGSFIVIAKNEVEEAKAAYDSDSTNWLEIAKKAGADVALKAKVLEFSGTTTEGYSEEEINDSQLEAERGDGHDKRVYKVKALRGKVSVELSFGRLDQDDVRIGIATEAGEVIEESRTKAARLPPKMRYLESLANEAFRDFFEKHE